MMVEGSSASIGDFVSLLRPKQWVKNVVVFAAPAAGLKLFAANEFLHASAAFLAFCFAASATYTINDTVDRHADALHPEKRTRPIARGAVSPFGAISLGLVMIALSLSMAWLTSHPAVLAVVAAYFLMQVAYSLGLKKRVILDVIIIATGFVLRAWAGGLAVGIATSQWLIACMFTLCLFMGFCKRRSELAMIGSAEEAGHHRSTLLRYTPEFLTHLITVSAGIAVITFLLYTLDSGVPTPFHKEHLFYTLPIVVYGIFRFAMLSDTGEYTGPTEIILGDGGMALAILVWALAAMVIAYQTTLFGPQGLEGLLGTSVAVPAGL